MSKTHTIPYVDLPLEKFVWNRENQTLVAEASDFGRVEEGIWWLRRLYSDACDDGITVHSAKTGETRAFLLIGKNIQDGTLGKNVTDGEVLSWHFKPIEHLQGVRELIIIND